MYTRARFEYLQDDDLRLKTAGYVRLTGGGEREV